MNIVHYLTTPGSLVRIPSGELCYVRAFNATTNEVEVMVGIDALYQSRDEQYLDGLRKRDALRSFHFTRLRVGHDDE